MTRFENVGVFIRETFWLENSLSQNFSHINTPTFSNLVILHAYPPMKMEQSVPKRRHTKFIRREITQKKAYNTVTLVIIPGCHTAALSTISFRSKKKFTPVRDYAFCPKSKGHFLNFNFSWQF